MANSGMSYEGFARARGQLLRLGVLMWPGRANSSGRPKLVKGFSRLGPYEQPVGTGGRAIGNGRPGRAEAQQPELVNPLRYRTRVVKLEQRLAHNS